MPDFTKTPQYQRGLQILNAMDPHRRRLFTSATMDKRFAQTEMGRLLASMDFQRQREAAKYQEQEATQKLQMAEDEADFYRKSSAAAHRLGWANIAASGLSGLMRWQQNKPLIALYRGLARKLSGT